MTPSRGAQPPPRPRLLSGSFGGSVRGAFVAKPRTDAPPEARARELRKVADCLRSLADEVEAEQRRREAPRPRSIMRRDDRTRPYRAASGLLMDALELGGPEDESLRRVLLSWRAKPAARWRCFYHVCKAWRPLVAGRVVPSASDPRACAEAMRVIAQGVSLAGAR